MRFRSRVTLAFLLGLVLPMMALSFVVRMEMTSRLTGQYQRQVESLVAVIEEDLALEGDRIGAALADLRRAIRDDNRFRRGAVDRAQAERRYLLDFAGSAMTLTGLSMLQIQDDAGRIISSGHFRNEFDRLDTSLPRLLAAAPGGLALVSVRAPDGPFLALARVDSFQMAGRKFTIAGGVPVDRQFLGRLARGGDMHVTLVTPEGRSDSDATAPVAHAGGITREVGIPYADTDTGLLHLATFRVTHGMDELASLRRSVDRWFLIAMVAAVLLALVIAGWLAVRISRPIVELADKTAHLDLDRLDVAFETDREDEIGALSRLLGEMTQRLRASAAAIRDAERRATRGEMARQVNHDIRNGLTPIRNVFRHLAELSQNNPGKLADVFHERERTLASSIEYLDELASNYARLSARSEPRPCDLNEIARQIASSFGGGDVEVRTRLVDRAIVKGDAVSLRRVLENLVDNAIDSLESGQGSVTISTDWVFDDDGASRLQLTVADTGHGMTEDEMDHIFGDFYTTREGGTGLGLSIVRRIVMDLEGTIRVESTPGEGSRFTVRVPPGNPEPAEE